MELENGKINFQNFFTGLLSKLSEREQVVLKNRYQLTSDLTESATLKQIGDIYNITRERVRQIERDAINKIVALSKTADFSGDLQQLEGDCVEYLEKNGGLVREDHLLENYVKENHELDTLHSNAYLFALEHLFDSTELVDDHEYFYSVWTLKQIDLDKVAEFIAKLEQTIGDGKKLYAHDEMLDAAKAHLSEDLKATLQGFADKHNISVEDLAHAYLRATTKIDKNIMDQWGLASWDTVRPKKLSDKINLIMHKVTKPLHFREIADKIKEAAFDTKKICPATVHNELIANDNFILIGRGLYALKDWGYTSGTVAEIISRVLEDNGPMDKEAIYDKVLAQRKVNKSTIYLTLINKDKFARTDAGKFDVLK